MDATPRDGLVEVVVLGSGQPRSAKNFSSMARSMAAGALVAGSALVLVLFLVIASPLANSSPGREPQCGGFECVELAPDLPPKYRLTEFSSFDQGDLSRLETGTPWKETLGDFIEIHTALLLRSGQMAGALLVAEFGSSSEAAGELDRARRTASGALVNTLDIPALSPDWQVRVLETAEGLLYEATYRNDDRLAQIVLTGGKDDRAELQSVLEESAAALQRVLVGLAGA